MMCKIIRLKEGIETLILGEDLGKGIVLNPDVSVPVFQEMNYGICISSQVRSAGLFVSTWDMIPEGSKNIGFSSHEGDCSAFEVENFFELKKILLERYSTASLKTFINSTTLSGFYNRVSTAKSLFDVYQSYRPFQLLPFLNQDLIAFFELRISEQGVKDSLSLGCQGFLEQLNSEVVDNVYMNESDIKIMFDDVVADDLGISTEELNCYKYTAEVFKP